ncbi:MAG: TonB-dependent receptor [Bacteroidales bacterium]|nr:TonB-dependent receptor [Bacteroidales bacterium]
MKNLLFSCSPHRRMYKILLFMKLTIILMLIFTLNLSATGFGQISLKEKGKSVKEILGILEKETNYRFFYNDDLKSIDNLVDIQVEDANIDKVLDELFKSTEFDYKLMDNNLIVIMLKEEVPQQIITGKVTDASTGEGLIGVSIVLKGTTIGVNSDINGNYSISAPAPDATLLFSFIGYSSQEVLVSGRSKIDISLELDVTTLEEVVVVGYGTQKKSDITGTVTSLPKGRLENVPNINIAQAIQGSVPGIMIQQSSAGAAPSEVIMIRGRNSILADNSPLIIVDGIPYGGQIRDISTNDVQSIEILKDASAAAIYGSRGSNGVILITTKSGTVGKTTLTYDGYYSVQKFSELPEIMTGEEFYNFKQARFPGQISLSEQAVFDAGKGVNWLDLGLRKGASQQHNLSASGGFQNTKFYIAGSLLDVKGIAVNDDYKRITSRVNVDTKIKDWLTIGTRTQFSFDDRSGSGPSMSGLLWTNPLSTPYDENGDLTVYPWPEDLTVSNPLQGLLYDNIDKSYQILTNNFVLIDFPFIKGLSYRINSGIRLRFTDSNTYRGRNTASGLGALGSADTDRSLYNNTVLENIFSYNREFGLHNIFATALYSYEGNSNSSNTLFASSFPHDFLKIYSAAQAELIQPGFTFNDTKLISQMVRLNYSYSSRYLLTVTGRRDGYSGFGAQKKWGFFPSVAMGWNLSSEPFFPWKDLFNKVKIRASWGLNGNQAVGAYESISRLGSEDMVDGKATAAGYVPSRLGQDELGWETSSTLNGGIDFGILKDRISGEINFYNTTTSDLLLNRTISPVHGINSITQNIGKTQNLGFEFSINSKNIDRGGFQWVTSGNIAYLKNKIISLYGIVDENGKEVDDIVNSWFIGKPIRVIYDFEWVGTWQTEESAEAAAWGSQPGFVKLKDVNGDGKLTADDKQIIGQQDPKLLWGLTNSFTYKQFKFDIFIHGVQGITKNLFPLMTDLETFSVIRRNTTKKDWWTPDNPTNEFVMNNLQAEYMAGIRGYVYDPASFIRLKDVSVSYDFPTKITEKAGLSKLKVYFTGRNLLTFTEWRGLDPELSNQEAIPLQKEYVFGLSFGF